MGFEIAGRMIGSDGRYKFDPPLLKVFEDGTNGTRVSPNKGRNFRGGLTAGMEPKNFKSAHDTLIRITVSKLLKGLLVFCRIVRSQHISLHWYSELKMNGGIITIGKQK